MVSFLFWPINYISAFELTKDLKIVAILVYDAKDYKKKSHRKLLVYVPLAARPS